MNSTISIAAVTFISSTTNLCIFNVEYMIQMNSFIDKVVPKLYI